MEYATDRPVEYASAAMQDRATVTSTLDEYEKLLAVLEETIDRHRARIGMVLTPTEPRPAPNGGALSASRPCSDLNTRVEGLNESLHRLTNSLGELTTRVEL